MAILFEQWAKTEIARLRTEADALQRALDKYLEAQRTSRSSEVEERQYPPELYRKFNRNVMRFWTLLGPTTNRSLLMIAGLLNNASIFLWPVVTVGNIILIAAIIWQQKVLRQLDATMKLHGVVAEQNESVTA